MKNEMEGVSIFGIVAPLPHIESMVMRFEHIQTLNRWEIVALRGSQGLFLWSKTKAGDIFAGFVVLSKKDRSFRLNQG